MAKRRGNRNAPGRNAGGRKPPQPRTRPIQLVAPVQNRAPRRRRRTRARLGNKQVSVTLECVSASIQGNGSDVFKFGPSLSISPTLTAWLKSVEHYRINSLTVKWVSEASSTDRGCMAIHVDPGLTCTGADVSLKDSWSLTKGFTRTFPGHVLKNTEWINDSSDQFWLAYHGTGSAVSAGHFKFIFNVTFDNPK